MSTQFWPLVLQSCGSRLLYKKKVYIQGTFLHLACWYTGVTKEGNWALLLGYRHFHCWSAFLIYWKSTADYMLWLLVKALLFLLSLFWTKTVQCTHKVHNNITVLCPIKIKYNIIKTGTPLNLKISLFCVNRVVFCVFFLSTHCRLYII